MMDVSPAVQFKSCQANAIALKVSETGVQVLIELELETEMMETGVQVCPEVQDSCCQTDCEVELTEKSVQVDLFLTAESLENNDKKVQYYTGLPNFTILSLVFDIVTSGMILNRDVLIFHEIFWY